MQYSERALRRIQDRVDWRAHAGDGFHIAGTGVHIDRNAVVIDLITRRQDAQAYFRARYGPAVTTEVIATEVTSPFCTDLFAYRLEPDGTTLSVIYEAGGGATLDHVELAEFPDRVEVAVVVQLSNGAITGDSRVAEVALPLAAPLGSRLVIDVQTEKRLSTRDPRPVRSGSTR